MDAEPVTADDPGRDAGRLEREVRAGGLLAAGRPVVVMLSGGRDSVCLLDLAVRIAGAGAVHALHVNYGMRADADGDEGHCRTLCARLGVSLEVHRVGRAEGVGPGACADPAERLGPGACADPAERNGPGACADPAERGGPGRAGPGRADPDPPARGNFQARARDQRYAAAGALADRRGAEIAAGHTSTDQVETILYRLASSPSRRALLGMRPRDGRLVRPLLQCSRAQTAAYCRARGLGWREDETNASGTYARGRVRHGLVPALELIHPAAAANVLAVAEILAQEAAVLDELVDSALRGREEIELAELRALPTALRGLVVQRLADHAAGRPAAGVARRADEISALSDRGRAALDLPHGVRVTAAQGVLRFGATPHGPLRLRDVSDDPAIGEILVGAEDLRRRVRELGQQVSRDYAGKDLVLIGVLKGAVFFLSDLMRELDIPVEVDFMAVASYGSATKSSGVVRILKDLDAAIEGRDVLIVEDIVDSGLTLQYLLRNLAGRNPASLEVCALLIKPERRKVELQTRYVGFEIPDRFAIGYGLDHGERYRNLPYVAALKE